MRPSTFVLCGSALLGMAVLLFTVPAWAGDLPQDRATLKGIEAIQVLISPIDPDAEKDGLTRSQIQTDVDLRFRQARIKVDSSSTEYLYVGVDVYKNEQAPIYSFSIKVECVQAVTLSRDAKIVSPSAVTWSVGVVGLTGTSHLPELRSQVADLVDKFINAYLEQNPRQ